MFRPAAVAAALLAALALAACDGSRTSEDDGRLQVVVSLPLFADFVHQVGGDLVEVSSLLPSGADPHTYEPTPQDIRRMTEADVIFINGRGLEASLEDAVENVVQTAPGTVAEFWTAFAPRIAREEPSLEPHFWLSAENAVKYVEVVREALSFKDPAHKSEYEKNAARYIDSLRALDAEIEEQVSRIPPENRQLVTFHNAFVHFAERYGLELVGFATPSSAQEPSPRDIQRLVTAIRDEGVPAVFSEPGFRDAVLRQVAAEADVQICVLYSDALDDRVQTYIDMMRFNADELARCLGV